MSYKALFYWLTVADSAKSFFLTFTILFTIVNVISWVSYFINLGDMNETGVKLSKNWIWYSTPFAILFWTLFIFTPSKRDALLIVAGGSTLDYLVQDSTAKQIPKELINFVSVELRNLATETGVQLQINSKKEEMLDKVKDLSAKELIDLMKQDTTYKQLILQ